MAAECDCAGRWRETARETADLCGRLLGNPRAADSPYVVAVGEATVREMARLLREAEPPDFKPRDFRWQDVPRPDPVTGIAPLAPTAAADDVPALLAEADAWCADRALPLRSALVADLAAALREMQEDRDQALAQVRWIADKALAERDAARAERDRLARRIQAIVAVANGARAVAPDDEAPDDPPCGWNSR